MPRKSPDPDDDFKIFVDPSCLSAPMDEETPAFPQTTATATTAIRDIPPMTESATTEATDPKEFNEIRSWRDIHLGPSRGPSRPQSAMEGATVEDTIDGLLEEIRDAEGEGDGHNQLENDGEDVGVAEEHQHTDIDMTQEEHNEEQHNDIQEEETHEQEGHGEASFLTEDCSTGDEPQLVEVEDNKAHVAETEAPDGRLDGMPVQEDESFQEEASMHEESGLHEVEPSTVDSADNDPESVLADDGPPHDGGSVMVEQDDGGASRRSSALSDLDRRGSLRTEALIQAAARAVVAQIEERAIAAVHSHRASLSSNHVDEEANRPLLSSTPHKSLSSPDSTTQPNDESPSRRESSTSSTSQIHHHLLPSSSSSEEANDSSSHHDSDPDVFSDRSSARSSLSYDGSTHPAEQAEHVKNPVLHGQRGQATPSGTRSSASRRLSAVSSLSQYDRDAESAAVPTSSTTRGSRDTPRMPFRTPSDVRAIQMSTSPTPSVFNGASPRSARRNGLLISSSGGGGPPPVSAQYSPKGRSTPPRFKMRKEAPPLVLLHVTLLPLRWVWGEVLDGLDGGFAAAVAGKGEEAGGGKEAGGFGPSEELVRLRDAWRQLRDRVGDTVLERGILLPHPQNDYEVLEERLLEALELPLRRRARILECGHYLGPANEMGDEEEAEEEQSGDEDEEYDVQTGRFRRLERKHWCGTCKGEIKYESLGPGRVFRVKVYASNGLMKAGAWAACWKEMERVDVEVEPIVDTALHRELERLAAFQVEQEERHQRELEEEERARHEEGMRAEEEARLPTPQLRVRHDEPDILSFPQQAMLASPPTPIQPTSPVNAARFGSSFLQEPSDTASSSCRRREEARLREIYGTSPPPAPEPEFDHAIPSSIHAEPPTSAFRSDVTPQIHPEHRTPTASSYIPPPSPRSPSEEAAERRAHRRTGAYQSASLPELVFEAVKVLMRDRKNVAVAVLAVFVVLLAMRPAGQNDVGNFRVESAGPVVADKIVVAQDGYVVEGVATESWDVVPAFSRSAIAESVVEKIPIEATNVMEASHPEATAAGVGAAAESVPPTEPGPEVAGASVDDIASSGSAVSSSSLPEETLTEKRVVRIVETVTETVKVSVTATGSVVAAQETKRAEPRTDVGASVRVPAGTESEQGSSALGSVLRVCLVKKPDVCLVGQATEDSA